MARRKASQSTKGLSRMAAALAAFAGVTFDTKGKLWRVRKAPVYGPEPKATHVVASKGVRSRRRRAARMCSRGCRHVDGFGWVHPADIGE